MDIHKGGKVYGIRSYLHIHISDWNAIWNSINIFAHLQCLGSVTDLRKLCVGISGNSVKEEKFSLHFPVKVVVIISNLQLVIVSLTWIDLFC